MYLVFVEEVFECWFEDEVEIEGCVVIVKEFGVFIMV